MKKLSTLTSILFSLIFSTFTIAQCDVDITFDIDTSCTDGFHQVTAIPSGGSGNYTFAWNTGATTPQITLSGNGTYSVTVSDGICEVTDLITIGLGEDINICHGESTILSTANCDNCAYLWSDGNTQPERVVSPTTTTQYIVTVTTPQGCSASDTITVNVNPIPEVSITTDINGNICPNTEITLTAVPSSCENCQFRWENGEFTATRHLIPESPANYRVTVTNSYGCKNSSEISLSVIDLKSNLTVTTGCNATATVTPSGGSGNYNINWSTGADTTTIDNLNVGEYEVSISDGECELVESFAVSPIQNIEIEEEYKIIGYDLLLNCQNREGGYFATGSKFGKLYLLKISETGTIEKSILFSETTPWNNISFNLMTTVDGGFILASQYGYLIRYDNNLNAVWAKKHDFTFATLKEIDDGNFFATNKQHSNLTVMKIGGDGNKIWSKIHGGDRDQSSADFQQTSDGGFIICGSSDENYVTRDEDLWILKLDSNGELEWEHTYGGSKRDAANHIIISPDNHYIVIGRAQSTDGDVELHDYYHNDWMLELNEIGDILHSHIFNFHSIEQVIWDITGSGFFLVNKNKIVKYASVGNLDWVFRYNIHEITNYSNRKNQLFLKSTDRLSIMSASTNSLLALQNMPTSNTEFLGKDYNICQSNYSTSVHFEIPRANNCEGCQYLWQNGDTTSYNSFYLHNEIGTHSYSVTVTDSTGCSVSDTIQVTLLPKPSLNLEAPEFVCEETPFEVEAICPNDGDYLLEWKNNPEFDNQNIIPDTISHEKHYTARIIDNNGCINSSSIWVEVDKMLPQISSHTLCGEGTFSASVHVSSLSDDLSYSWSNGATTQELNDLSSGTYSVTVNNGVCNADTSVILEPTSAFIKSGHFAIRNVNYKKLQDGSIILAGSNYYWNNSLYLKKYGTNGEIIWEYSYNNIGANIVYTFDEVGNLFYLEPQDLGFKLTKRTPGDIEEWSSFIYSDVRLVPVTIEITNDNGFVIIGNSHLTVTNDTFVAKLNQTGSLEWINNYGGLGNDLANKILVTTDDNYICASTVNSSTGVVPYFSEETAFWVFKLNQTGDILWSQAYGNQQPNEFIDLISVEDGNYVLGSANYLLKLSPAGQQIWTKNSLKISSIAPTSDNGIVLSQHIISPQPTNDAWIYGWHDSPPTDFSYGSGDPITKLDAEGNIVWRESLEGGESPTCVIPLPDNSYYVDYLSYTLDTWIEPEYEGYNWYNYHYYYSEDRTIDRFSFSIPPFVNLGPDTILCQGDTLTLSADQSNNNAYYYEWSTESDAPEITVTDPGLYSVIVGNQLGCIDADAIFVDYCNTFQFISQEVICDSTKVTAHFNDAEYMWSTGETTKEIFTRTPGWIFVDITHPDGHIIQDSLFIEVGTNTIELNAAVVEPTCYGGSDGSIDLTVTGGYGDYDYRWNSFPAHEEDRTNIKAGVYNVTITDEKHCQKLESWTVNQPERINCSVFTEHVLCHGESDGKLILTATGGTGDLDYLWDTGETTPTIDNLSAGTYTITVTDENDCQAEHAAIVLEPSAALSYTAETTNPTDDNDDGIIHLTISGGTQAYSVTWNTGQTGPLITDLPEGFYSFTITDAHGCTLSDEIHLSMTAIHEPLRKNLFGLKPNPASDFINITVKNRFFPKGSIQINDILGREVKTIPTGSITNTNNVKIDVSNLNTGMYFVSILEKGEKLFTFKVSIVD